MSDNNTEPVLHREAEPADAGMNAESPAAAEPAEAAAPAQNTAEAAPDCAEAGTGAAQPPEDGQAPEASGREECACAEPEEPAEPAKPAAAARRNPARKWGILIGAALGLLCLACMSLAGNLVISRGGAAVPGTPPVIPQEEDVPRDDEMHLQVHEVPREEDGYTTQYIAENVMDSVVGILAYDGTSVNPASGGTGIVMSEDGYIITNAHVVVGATGLTVVMNDDTKYSARLLGYDEKTDLAVIKIKAEGLHPAEFGDSDAVVVGERAIAIGNPNGLSGSVSQGVISGLNREITIILSDGTSAVLTAMQTDAAINPGNSGGPLLNAWGQVIGINSSKIVKNGFEGIGFSIPVNQAKPIIDNLIHYGYVKDRAVLGISVIALDAVNGPANGLPEEGLYIATIAEFSDMRNHGIEPGDVILRANGRAMKSTDDLTEELLRFHPGDTIEMEILHVYDGEVITAGILLVDSNAGK